jgi:flagellar FliJ protein
MPPPFRFKLEKVLEYRRSLEEQAKLALAQAQQAHDRQQEVLAQLKDSLEKHRSALNSRRDVTMQDLWLYEQYERRMSQDIIEADAALQELALKLQLCRKNALSRSTDRKLLEKLKTRQAEKHHAEEQQKEQKEFDEAAAVRYEPPDI